MKAKIIQIGKVENGKPVNWSFDSFTNIPGLSVSGEGIIYYGYSAKDLEEISTNNLEKLSMFYKIDNTGI